MINVDAADEVGDQIAPKMELGQDVEITEDTVGDVVVQCACVERDVVPGSQLQDAVLACISGKGTASCAKVNMWQRL